MGRMKDHGIGELERRAKGEWTEEEMKTLSRTERFKLQMASMREAYPQGRETSSVVAEDTIHSPIDTNNYGDMSGGGVYGDSFWNEGLDVTAAKITIPLVPLPGETAERQLLRTLASMDPKDAAAKLFSAGITQYQLTSLMGKLTTYINTQKDEFTPRPTSLGSVFAKELGPAAMDLLAEKEYINKDGDSGIYGVKQADLTGSSNQITPWNLLGHRLDSMDFNVGYGAKVLLSNKEEARTRLEKFYSKEEVDRVYGYLEDFTGLGASELADRLDIKAERIASPESTLSVAQHQDPNFTLDHYVRSEDDFYKMSPSLLKQAFRGLDIEEYVVSGAQQEHYFSNTIRGGQRGQAELSRYDAAMENIKTLMSQLGIAQNEKNISEMVGYISTQRISNTKDFPHGFIPYASELPEHLGVSKYSVTGDITDMTRMQWQEADFGKMGYTAEKAGTLKPANTYGFFPNLSEEEREKRIKHLNTGLENAYNFFRGTWDDEQKRYVGGSITVPTSEAGDHAIVEQALHDAGVQDLDVWGGENLEADKVATPAVRDTGRVREEQLSLDLYGGMGVAPVRTQSPEEIARTAELYAAKTSPELLGLPKIEREAEIDRIEREFAAREVSQLTSVAEEQLELFDATVIDRANRPDVRTQSGTDLYASSPANIERAGGALTATGGGAIFRSKAGLYGEKAQSERDDFIRSRVENTQDEADVISKLGAHIVNSVPVMDVLSQRLESAKAALGMPQETPEGEYMELANQRLAEKYAGTDYLKYRRGVVGKPKQNTAGWYEERWGKPTASMVSKIMKPLAKLETHAVKLMAPKPAKFWDDDKTFIANPNEGNYFTNRGQRMESALQARLEKEMGEGFIYEEAYFEEREGIPGGASPDLRIFNKETGKAAGLAEFKVAFGTSKHRKNNASEWEIVRDKYLETYDQMQYQMLISGENTTALMVLRHKPKYQDLSPEDWEQIDEEDWHKFDVAANPERQAQILERLNMLEGIMNNYHTDSTGAVIGTDGDVLAEPAYQSVTTAKEELTAFSPRKKGKGYSPEATKLYSKAMLEKMAEEREEKERREERQEQEELGASILRNMGRIKAAENEAAAESTRAMKNFTKSVKDAGKALTSIAGFALSGSDSGIDTITRAKMAGLEENQIQNFRDQEYNLQTVMGDSNAKRLMDNTGKLAIELGKAGVAGKIFSQVSRAAGEAKIDLGFDYSHIENKNADELLPWFHEQAKKMSWSQEDKAIVAESMGIPLAAAIPERMTTADLLDDTRRIDIDNQYTTRAGAARTGQAVEGLAESGAETAGDWFGEAGGTILKGAGYTTGAVATGVGLYGAVVAAGALPGMAKAAGGGIASKAGSLAAAGGGIASKAGSLAGVLGSKAGSLAGVLGKGLSWGARMPVKHPVPMAIAALAGASYGAYEYFSNDEGSDGEVLPDANLGPVHVKGSGEKRVLESNVINNITIGQDFVSIDTDNNGERTRDVRDTLSLSGQ
jgi:hypothetical protein